MFRLMRNIHLGLGLIFVLMALIFAVSSLVIIYRPWLAKSSPRVSESTVRLPLEAAASHSTRLSAATASTHRGQARVDLPLRWQAWSRRPLQITAKWRRNGRFA